MIITKQPIYTNNIKQPIYIQDPNLGMLETNLNTLNKPT
jgi:hypothetical protein